MRRALLLTVPLLALVPLLGSGQATAQAECRNGAYPYAPTTDAHVTFSGLPTTPGNEIGLGIERTGGGEINPDSMRYEVDGPAGHSSIPADRYMTAQYTPTVAGTYSGAAHWTEYTCSDYSTSTSTTTPAATLTTIVAKPPTVLVRASRRPKVHNS